MLKAVRPGNLWVDFGDFVADGRIHDYIFDHAPAVDKPPAHRTSLWTAAARCVTCPPLPDLEPTA
jgi:hypothetical protein